MLIATALHWARIHTNVFSCFVVSVSLNGSELPTPTSASYYSYQYHNSARADRCELHGLCRPHYDDRQFSLSGSSWRKSDTVSTMDGWTPLYRVVAFLSVILRTYGEFSYRAIHLSYLIFVIDVALLSRSAFIR